MFEQARVIAHVLEHLDRDDAIEARGREKVFMSQVIDRDVFEAAARAARGDILALRRRVRHARRSMRAGIACAIYKVSEPQPQPSSRIVVRRRVSARKRYARALRLGVRQLSTPAAQ